MNDLTYLACLVKPKVFNSYHLDSSETACYVMSTSYSSNSELFLLAILPLAMSTINVFESTSNAC